MGAVAAGGPDAKRARRRLTSEIKSSLRELNSQLSLLNHQVGSQLEIKDTDFDCLDLISRHGPLSPTALARHAGLHPATVTGILDRLERGGWISRERVPDDRRAVVVQTRRERGAELFRRFSGMNTSLTKICADYDEDQLQLIADFLDRTINAGRRAVDRLADG